MNIDQLHAAIMNLAEPSLDENCAPQMVAGYRAGFRDARHAAAELVSHAAAEVGTEQPFPQSTERGPTGESRCPECRNSLDNAKPFDRPDLLLCANCKIVFKPLAPATAPRPAGAEPARSNTWCDICGKDVGRSSHWHCPNCGGRCSMMGHWDSEKQDYSCQRVPNPPNMEQAGRAGGEPASGEVEHD